MNHPQIADLVSFLCTVWSIFSIIHGMGPSRLLQCCFAGGVRNYTRPPPRDEEIVRLLTQIKQHETDNSEQALQIGEYKDRVKRRDARIKDNQKKHDSETRNRQTLHEYEMDELHRYYRFKMQEQAEYHEVVLKKYSRRNPQLRQHLFPVDDPLFTRSNSSGSQWTSTYTDDTTGDSPQHQHRLFIPYKFSACSQSAGGAGAANKTVSE